MSYKTKKYFLCLYILMALVGITGCRNGNTSTTEETKHAKPQVPVEVRLSTQDTPSLGGTARLTMEVKPLIPAPSIKLRFILPEGLESIDGESSWAGSMAQGETRRLEILVRFSHGGHYVVQGMATLEQEGRTYAGIDSLVIDLEEQKRPLIGIDQEKAQPQPDVKKSRDNRDVIEFKAK